jgi:hypothetical protein
MIRLESLNRNGNQINSTKHPRSQKNAYHFAINDSVFFCVFRAFSRLFRHSSFPSARVAISCHMTSGILTPDLF